ncbi:MFS transporter [Andreprevotia chitinilytica]|uniref:MFS transporter n=1 Tax=Andreprevotia chitinilytica TaxID=396808 RepID=UPI000553C54E|nr:MFS transporter [Andreprevotia chitinilytica]
MFSRTHLPASFQRLAWSNLVAQSAEQISLAAAPIVAVFVLGANASQTGLLQAAQTLPFLLLAIPLGVWADRHSRRRLMVGGEICRVIAMLSVLCLAATQLLSLPLLALLGFIGATGTLAYSVAAPSLIPALVPRPLLTAANGRIELVRSIAYSAGPAAGGLMVGWVGAGWAYGVATGLSAFAVALLIGVDEPPRDAKPARHFFTELKEGAHFAINDPLLRPIIATAAFFNIGFFTLQAVYVPYAVQHLRLSASTVGLTLACNGVGMVCGALATPRIMRKLVFGQAFAIGPLCGLLAAMTMAATLVVPSFWLACISYFLFGAGPILWTISSTTLRQAITPQGMLGRLSAINSTTTYGARPLGALLGASVSMQFGMGASLIVAVIAFMVQALLILRSPAVRLTALPDRIVLVP